MRRCDVPRRTIPTTNRARDFLSIVERCTAWYVRKASALPSGRRQQRKQKENADNMASIVTRQRLPTGVYGDDNNSSSNDREYSLPAALFLPVILVCVIAVVLYLLVFPVVRAVFDRGSAASASRLSYINSIAPLFRASQFIFDNDANPSFVRQKHQIQFARFLRERGYTAATFLQLSRGVVVDLIKQCFGFNDNSQWFTMYANNIPDIFNRPATITTSS